MSILPKFAVAFLIAAMPAIAQEGSMKLVYNSGEQKDQEEITIMASQVVFEREIGVTTFSGDVTVSQEGLTIAADFVEVHAVEGQLSEIEYLLAQGSLEIVAEGGTATARMGRYTVASKIIELTGNVVFLAEDSTLSGDHLTYDVTTGESRLTGSASATIDPGGE